MFSVRQKREIANAIQTLLRSTNHPELPEGEISFTLSIQGRYDWSYANIRNNGVVTHPDVNPHNEWVDHLGGYQPINPRSADTPNPPPSDT